MAAVDQVNVAGIAATGDEEGTRKAISAMFWLWYDTHKSTKVTEVSFWFIRKTVYVDDLFPLFELLFGAHP